MTMRIYTHKNAGTKFLVSPRAHRVYERELGRTLTDTYDIQEFEDASEANRVYEASFVKQHREDGK